METSTFSDVLDAMWDDFDDRLREICHLYRTTKKAIGEKCGFNPTQLSQAKGNGQHRIAYRILLAYPEINARWLLFGQGSMTEQQPVEQEQQQQQQPQQPQQESREYLSLLQAYRAAIEENVRLQMTIDTLRSTRPYSVTDDTPLPAAAEDPAPYPRKKQA